MAYMQNIVSISLYPVGINKSMGKENTCPSSVRAGFWILSTHGNARERGQFQLLREREASDERHCLSTEGPESLKGPLQKTNLV